MTNRASIGEKDLISGIQAGDKIAFRSVFKNYFNYLLVISNNLLCDSEKAKDLTHDVFVDLWAKRTKININNSLKFYLRKSVINKTLNYIKAQRMDFLEPAKLPETISIEGDPQKKLEGEDLQNLIDLTVKKLPKGCRTVFVLCRIENMSHKEIAAVLNISTKTVENQMTKALKVLRVAIAHYSKKNL